MNAQTIAVIFERFGELVETKMATSKAAKQVADEVVAFEKYCNKTRIKPIKITTKNLELCKYK